MFHLSVIKVQLEDAAGNHTEENHEKLFSSSPYIYRIFFLYIYSGSTLTVINRKINTFGKKENKRKHMIWFATIGDTSEELKHEIIT